MRISDWSSDVCSSDLRDPRCEAGHHRMRDIFDHLAETEQAGRDEDEPGEQGCDQQAVIAMARDDVEDPDDEGARRPAHLQDRKSVVKGKSVSVRVNLGGSRIIKTKKKNTNKNKT